MLDHLEAEKIVKDCIRQVRGFGGGVESSNKLQQVGIITADLVKDLRDTIATDPDIGVQSVRDHRIAISALNFSTGTKVLQVQNLVLFNAKAPEELHPPLGNFAFELSQTKPKSDDKAALAGLSVTGSFIGEDDNSSKKRSGKPRKAAAKKAGKKGGGK